jgi:hypothetical protein
MKNHPVCETCVKDCKQPYSKWDMNETELKFCKNFQQAKSKLPVEILDELIIGLKTQNFPSVKEIFIPYLQSIRELYIPCTTCKRLIAPDEAFEVHNDETAVCLECASIEN